MNCLRLGRLGPSCQVKLVETKRTGQIALERIAQVHAGARLKTIRVHALGADQQQGVSKGVADGVTDSLLPTSMVFYAGMTVAAVALGQAFGMWYCVLCHPHNMLTIITRFLDVDVAAQLLNPSIDPAPTLGTVALLLSFALVTQRYTDKVTALKEIEVLMRSTMLPALRAGPWWGIPLLALGAGVGEETLFRALLQQGLEQQFVAQGGLSQLWSVTVASIVFGLAHAINWAYFAFATLGGAVFGMPEACVDNVVGCMLTVVRNTAIVYGTVSHRH